MAGRAPPAEDPGPSAGLAQRDVRHSSLPFFPRPLSLPDRVPLGALNVNSLLSPSSSCSHRGLPRPRFLPPPTRPVGAGPGWALSVKFTFKVGRGHGELEGDLSPEFRGGKERGASTNFWKETRTQCALYKFLPFSQSYCCTGSHCPPRGACSWGPASFPVGR